MDNKGIRAPLTIREVWGKVKNNLDASHINMDEWPAEWKDAFNKACGEAQMRIMRERFHLTPDECYESAK